jgi:hypothetical protein
MSSLSKIGRVCCLALGSVSLVYLWYVRRCFGYLKSLGYDHPPPSFLLGNLAEFASPANSIPQKQQKRSEKEETPPPAIAHYSKTLQRWRAKYGKIYGYYEGHSPVLVLADADLVADLFLGGQSKMHASHRRTFPMSKPSSHPSADVFLANGIKWLRMRHALEKVMLNARNVAKCMRYLDESFTSVFTSQKDEEQNCNDTVYKRAKLLMVQSMFLVVFGTDLEHFVSQEPRVGGRTVHSSSPSTRKKLPVDHLKNTRLVAHQFHKAFIDFESFSPLKFAAMIVPELAFVWRAIDLKLKPFVNAFLFRCDYLADPMHFFYVSFINKYLMYKYLLNDFTVSNVKLTSKNNFVNAFFLKMCLKTVN